MTKYIECEAAYRFAQDQLKKETGAYSKGWNNAMNVIKGALHNNDALPAADVVPVRHGRWEWYDSFSYRCSACEKYWIAPGDQYDYHYCPNCGARMDGDGE